MTPRFYLDPEFFTSVYEKKKMTLRLYGEPTVCFSTITSDHPEFAKLREELEATGFIRIERGWWNGDEVLETFFLNDIRFSLGESFYCAAAMGTHFSLLDETFTNKYDVEYQFRVVAENKIELFLTDKNDYRNVWYSGKDGTRGLDYSDLGAVDLDGGPYIPLGYRIKNRVVEKISRESDRIYFYVGIHK